MKPGLTSGNKTCMLYIKQKQNGADLVRQQSEKWTFTAQCLRKSARKIDRAKTQLIFFSLNCKKCKQNSKKA